MPAKCAKMGPIIKKPDEGIMKLPLHKEELRVLMASGNSVGELSEELNEGGGRIRSLIVSIFLKMGVNTIEKSRKKFKEGRAS